MRPVPPQALALVKSSEGFRASCYSDTGGLPTIGYGHKLRPGDPLLVSTISEAAAEELAEQDLAAAGAQLTSVLGDAQITELSDGQWSALLDFTFNEGIGQFEASTLCAKIKTGQLASASIEFNRWVYGKVNGVETVLSDLVARRASETALWNS